MSDNVTRRARLRVMHRPGSTITHAFRVVDEPTASVCTRVRVAGKLCDAHDGTVTCQACVDAVTGPELGSLIRLERAAGRPAATARELAEVVEILSVLQLAAPPEEDVHELADVLPFAPRQLALFR